MIITDDNYASVVSGELPVVIDFWATWCGPCKKVGPIIEELEKQFEGKVIVGKSDVEENTELTERFGIRNVPTIVFIKNGEVVDKVVGAAAKSVFEEKIQALL